MSRILITTTPTRVKRAGNWCEDADEQTNTILSKYNYTWDQEMPIEWVIDTLGLSTTLLCLGEPRPKFKKRCDEILLEYIKKVYKDLCGIAEHYCGFTFIQHENFILSKDRRQASIQEKRLWAAIKTRQEFPLERAVCEGMIIVFSDIKNNLMAIQSTKELLMATKLLHGDTAAEKLTQELSDFIREELNK